MTAVWDRLWLDFQTTVEVLNKAVKPEDRGFLVRVERSDNDVFPLRAVATFAPLSSPGDEALVLSMDFRRSEDRVEGHLDLAHGDGLVLADEPLGVAPETDPAALDSSLRAARSKLERFVRMNQSAIERELSRLR